MGSNSKMGLYEVAYANVAHYLLKERGAIKQETRQLKHPDTFLDKIVSCWIDSGNMILENLNLFMVDPLKVTIAESEVYWGMLALTPGYSNIIGAVFHQPLNQSDGIETMCGLLLNQSKMQLVYMAEPKSFVHCIYLDFTTDNVSTILEKVNKDTAADKLFTLLPKLRNLTTELVTIVNDELLKYPPKELTT